MADIVLRDIDPEMVERIKSVARQRGWTIHDVILHVLRQGLGLSAEEPRIPGDVARLAGAWDDREANALREAISALEHLPDDTFLDETGQRYRR